MNPIKSKFKLFYNSILCVILFCLTLLAGCAANKAYESVPELVSINLVDRSGMSETISQKDRLKQYSTVDFLESQSYQKILRVYARDSLGSIKAIITSYHPNGQIKQYLEVSDNRAFGSYREWFLDGTLKLETHVIGGVADLTTAAEKSWLFDGCSQIFNESGNLIASIEYSKGELVGTSRYYHSNGNLWRTVPFCKNLVEGVVEVYLEDGSLFQTSEFSQDVKNGKTLRYWPNKRLSSDETYMEGRLITAYYYDLNGQIVAEIQDGQGYRAAFAKETISELQEFNDGSLQGKIQVFDLQSNLIKIYHVRNEVKHGEEIEFYPSSDQPKISISWMDGKIHGQVKTWYQNGVLETTREMTNNAKNGLFTAWYLDGSVMFIESYDHDKLAKGKYFKKQEKTPVSEVTDGNGTATLHDANGNFVKKIKYRNSKPDS